MERDAAVLIPDTAYGACCSCTDPRYSIWSVLQLYPFTFTFSRHFYPKRLTMYTHFTFTLMAHSTSGAVRGSVSCSRTMCVCVCVCLCVCVGVCMCVCVCVCIGMVHVYVSVC